MEYRPMPHDTSLIALIAVDGARHPRFLAAITRTRLQPEAEELVALQDLRNPRVFEKHLRAADIPAVSGDATLPGVLESVHVERARLLVIASPDGFHARQVLAQALARNPKIRTIVRTHSAEEREYLETQGVDSVVMGEHELAMTMTAYALQSLKD
ncbi:MAG: NAD-binding protein [Steroidobacteraceae bacterium]